MEANKHKMRLTTCLLIACMAMTACKKEEPDQVVPVASAPQQQAAPAAAFVPAPAPLPASADIPPEAPTVPAPAPAPVSVPTPMPAPPDPAPVPPPEPGAEPKPEPKPEPTPEPVSEPTPVPSPVSQPDPPPVSQPDPPPVSQPDPPTAEDPLPREPSRPISRSKVVPDLLNDFGAVGQTLQLRAHAEDENGETITGVSFTWVSSNPAAISVSSTGLATARGNGYAMISATPFAQNGAAAKGTAEGFVKQVVAAVVMTPDQWPTTQVWVGARRQFTAHAVDAAGNVMPDVPITWSVNNASRAHVDDTGLATVLDTGANTRVIATARGLNDSVTFTANPEDSDVPGYMYTAWFARTDITPAVLIDGRIALSETYYEGNDLPWTSPNSPWTGFKPPWPHDTIEKFQYHGNRIGLLTDVANGVGTVRVIDRAQDWAILALGNAQDFALEGNRIGVLFGNGELRARTGIGGGWSTLVDSGVEQFQLEGNRTGILHEDGTVRVKNGADPWELIDAAGVTQFQLEGNRTGVLTATGEFRVQDQPGAALTELAASGARQFALEGNRIALLLENGAFQVMDGLGGNWTVLGNEPIRQFVLEGSYIGILLESGEARVRNGIGGEWRVLATSNVKEIQIQGTRIGVLENNDALSNAGRLRIWENINAIGTDTMGVSNTTSVSQFRLIVDNPVPPFRTTTAGYNAGQARCDDLYWTPGCFSVVIGAFGLVPPVPMYGLFCGAFRPGSDEMGGAIRSIADSGLGGPIDAMDAMCMHHDLAGNWYPELPSGAGSYNPTQSCVVRYALMHGKLTHNGVVVADGNSSYGERLVAWAPAGMLHMQQAMEEYLLYTALCTDADLARFDGDTDAYN